MDGASQGFAFRLPTLVLSLERYNCDPSKIAQYAESTSLHLSIAWHSSWHEISAAMQSHYARFASGLVHLGLSGR
jgi:hypothetical protein